MTSIRPYLNVPDFIVNGLQDGSMFRTGGVIQETASGQIVAWLRETGEPNGLYASLMQGLPGIKGTDAGAMGIVLGALPLLHYALSSYAIQQSDKRIVHKLTQKIEREFWLDRMANLNAARDQFNSAYRIRSVEEKRKRLGNALSRLDEAKYPINSEILRLQDCSQLSDPDGEKALYYHLLAMNIYRMVALCNLELDEPEEARRTLDVALAEHEQSLRTFVRKRIGIDSPAQQTLWRDPERDTVFALFSNRSSFKRYIDILKWLGNVEIKRNTKPSSNILGKFLQDTNKSLAKSNFDNFISSKNFDEIILPQIYCIIESFDRLRGNALKLSVTAGPGMTFFSWEAYETSKATGHNGVVTFVDLDALSRLQRLRAKVGL